MSEATELLGTFDLTEAAERLVRTYSGGMRRRLDLAGALVARPPVVFLDEPTTGLDQSAGWGSGGRSRNGLPKGRRSCSRSTSTRPIGSRIGSP